MKRCEHNWHYEHTIYGDSDDRTAIHRQCRHCGRHEVAYAGAWRKPAIRAAAEKERQV